MKDRIKKIMESQHMTQKVFAQFTGISEGSLSGVFNDRTRPTIQMIEAIHAHLPKVSVEWIMFGTGPMYIDDNNGQAHGEVDKTSGTRLDMSMFADEAAAPLFEPQDTPQQQGVKTTPNNLNNTIVKYIDKPERHITEIRIFYDDQTWESFTPK